jgi:hypothetical protein
LPGLWCAGHAIAHELEPAHHEIRETSSAGDRLTGLAGLTEGHHHDHEHLDLPAVVSTDGAKKHDTPALLPVACNLDSSRASLQYDGLAGLDHTPRLASADSSPRAPPIS